LSVETFTISISQGRTDATGNSTTLFASEVIPAAALNLGNLRCLVAQVGGGGNVRGALYQWVGGGPAVLLAQSLPIAAALGVVNLPFAAPPALVGNTRYYLALGTTSNGLQFAAFQSGLLIDGQSTAWCVRDVNNFVAGAFPAVLNIGSAYQLVPWMRGQP
jgi:hypothetical protein